MQRTRLIAALTALFLLVGIIGCSQQKASAPSYKDSVKQALDNAGLKNVDVDEDRDKGVLTLKGKVGTEDEKMSAEQAAKSAAPGVVVANEISIEPQGFEREAQKIESSMDDAIENNFKAAIVGNKLEDQHIRYEANNGVLTLEGDVDTPALRQKAEKLAASVPNVTQVVNKLEVKKGKTQASTR
jgi:hyperosmotically inducible periplasmic protein